MLSEMIMIAGLFHGVLVCAGLCAAHVLHWRQELQKLEPLSCQLIWIHGGYIVMIIAAFGIGSVLLCEPLADGSTLSRAVCGFIGCFWGLRLVLQLLVFDAKSHLTTVWRRVGYHMLTVLFAGFAFVYLFAAIAPHTTLS